MAGTIETAEPCMIPLLGYCQKYKWGQPARTSMVADLVRHAYKHCAAQKCPVAPRGSESAADDHYAELWLGTHPSGPTLGQSGGADGAWRPLGELLHLREPLPYLLKVLSVGGALSVQAHPDKALAERLHREKPAMYPDSNHKPELTIALTEFECLCSFRAAAEIDGFLAELPALAELVRARDAAARAPHDDAQRVRLMFEALMHSDRDAIARCFDVVVRRSAEGAPQQLSPATADAAALSRKLHEQYPADAGTLVPFFFNHLHLQPGEAVFVAAGEPHAYLHGNCIECMACSDNVVRAGLTPKVIDKETLFAMLTYKLGAPCLVPVHCRALELGFLGEYQVPVKDFVVSEWTIPLDHGRADASASALIPYAHTSRILLVLQGSCSVVHGAQTVLLERGQAVFLPPHVDARLFPHTVALHSSPSTSPMLSPVSPLSPVPPPLPSMFPPGVSIDGLDGDAASAAYPDPVSLAPLRLVIATHG